VSDIGIVVRKTAQLLGEIVLDALASEKGLRVLGVVESEEELLDLCDRVQPDVVVDAAADTEVEAMGQRVLMRFPSIRLFALAADGLKTSLFELRPHKVEMGQLSPRDLARVVREGVRCPPGSAP
jgi:hypothetical protein